MSLATKNHYRALVTSLPFLFALSVSLSACNDEPRKSPDSASIGGPDSSTSITSENHTVLLHQDAVDEFSRTFSDYPWDLAQSEEAKALASEGLEVDFNSAELGRFSRWQQFSSWKAGEQKEKVITFLKAQLSNLAKALHAERPNSLGLTAIRFISPGSDLVVRGSLLGIPAQNLSTERLSDFIKQQKFFQDEARALTDGILVLPATIGTTALTPKLEFYQVELREFQSKVYPGIRRTLLQNRSMIDQIVLSNSQLEDAFEYSNLDRILRINSHSENLKTLDADLSTFLFHFAQISTELAGKIQIRFYVHHSFLDTSGRSPYEGAMAALDAIHSEENILMECSKRFNRILMQPCAPRGYGRASTDKCTVIAPESNTLVLQVAETDRNVDLVTKPLSAARIQENIRRVCGAPG